ncbi:MAG: 16S rRNA (cytosine(1402)-N(4))-methyltransferase RsmH [Proteobacteria bacterium]|nr:16S rRNA (cytosine(1402)-N(4))-methyltransferase RsmH [Pseudomonadota bacterium]
MTNAPHIPVMLPEVLEALAPRDGAIYVDGTFGAGGYTRGILAAATCKVVGIDRDPGAFTRAQTLSRDHADRFFPVHGTFGDVAMHLQALGLQQVDGFVLDLGVSSMQLDEAERGFSFAKDGPLDMRMDTTCGEPASILVNTLSEKELADIIWTYGEERYAKKIASAIVRARAEKKIETTLVLADIVSAAMPAASRKFAIHPATRTFQALRIAVNGELDQLHAALEAAIDVLAEGGRLVIVSFHSLEDTIVKNFFRKNGPAQAGSRHLPDIAGAPALFVQPFKKTVAASEAECKSNPRSRSAKLRWGIRTAERKAA